MWGNRRGADLRIESRSEAVLAGTGMHGHSKQGSSGNGSYGASGSRKLPAERGSEEASPGGVPVRVLELVHPVPSV
jgi:hypothetical protein